MDETLDQALAHKGLLIIGLLLLAGPLFIGLVKLVRWLRHGKRTRVADTGEERVAPPGKRSKEPPLWTRYFTLIGFSTVFLGSAYFGRWPFAFFILAVICIGLWEFWRLLRTCHIDPFPLLGWLSGIAILAVAFWWGAQPLGGTIALVAAILCASAVLIGGVDQYLSRTSGTLLGVIYVALLASFLVIMRAEPHGLGQILFFFAVIQFGDVFALLGGASIGGPKMVPSISPGKTWAGTISGLLGALLGAYVLGFVLPDHSTGLLVATGAALFATGLLGDLAASCLKRAGGIKDFSRLLPGHGGILDRFDSMLLSAPVAWMLLNLL
ncbi:MAG: phosphatidate cytidylyltransferase [Bradymonadales bacterium]|nr:phosphatidate cytidylyltransferase [Bradymonadales bacterium]